MAPTPIIVDRDLLRARLRRARALGPSTFLADRVGEELADRLAAVLRSFRCGLDLGTPTEAVRRVLARGGKVGTICAAHPLVGDALAQAEAGPTGLAVAADAEALPFRDGTLDLVV